MEHCYLCGQAIPGPLAEVHFADCNAMGCPGMQFDDGGVGSRKYMWWLNFFVTYPIMLLSIPFVLALAAVISVCGLVGTIVCCPCVVVMLYLADDSEAFLVIPACICGPYAIFAFYLLACFPWLAGMCAPCSRCVKEMF